MIAIKTVHVPANTAHATPLIIPWEVKTGLFYKLDIMFPPGPSGLVGVALYNALNKMYPFNEDEYFIADNDTITFDDKYLFSSETNQLEIHAYNDDDFYEHMIQFRLGIITDPDLIKSVYGFANVDTLISQLQVLNTLLIQANSAKPRFSTEALTKL